MSSETYIGTKSHALKGVLLDAGTIQKLAESTSLEELVNRLRGTPYSEVLTDLAMPTTARKLELALRERLAEVHRSIMSAGESYPLLGLYYQRNIAWDLKSALKAKALGKSFEESSEFIDMKAEELVGRRDLIVRVLSAKDINEAVSLLQGTEFYSDVEKALASYSAKGEVRFFDMYVDHAVLSDISREYSSHSKLYKSSRRVDVGGLRDMVATDIDAYNVLSVLRAKLWGLPEQELTDLVIRPTYRVSSAALARMTSAESPTEAAKLLEGSYGISVANSTGDEEVIDAIEDGFVSAMKRTASRSFVWQGLGLSTALAVVKLLEFEVGNLAAIAIGIEAGMEAKTILGKLRV